MGADKSNEDNWLSHQLEFDDLLSRLNDHSENGDGEFPVLEFDDFSVINWALGPGPEKEFCDNRLFFVTQSTIILYSDSSTCTCMHASVQQLLTLFFWQGVDEVKLCYFKL